MKKQKFTLLKNYAFVEIPEILFYENEDGNVYFDVTHYMNCFNRSQSLGWEDFLKQYSHPLQSLASIGAIEPDTICMIDEATAHLMAKGNISLLFAFYTDPSFLNYATYSVHMMLLRGFCISDHVLEALVNERFDMPLTDVSYDKEK